MALLMKIEYPDQWPSFFRDLLNLLNGAGPPVVDLFLRVIKAVDEEVVSHELVRYFMPSYSLLTRKKIHNIPDQQQM
jgi:hypothetical protein